MQRNIGNYVNVYTVYRYLMFQEGIDVKKSYNIPMDCDGVNRVFFNKLCYKIVNNRNHI